jgi:hypothetical protein
MIAERDEVRARLLRKLTEAEERIMAPLRGRTDEEHAALLKAKDEILAQLKEVQAGRCKSLGYAYVSSPLATQLGHGKIGCYYLRVFFHGDERATDAAYRKTIVATFIRREDALSAYRELELPSGDHCLVRRWQRDEKSSQG